MSPKFNQFSQFLDLIVQSSGSNNNSVKNNNKRSVFSVLFLGAEKTQQNDASKKIRAEVESVLFACEFEHKDDASSCECYDLQNVRFTTCILTRIHTGQKHYVKLGRVLNTML